MGHSREQPRFTRVVAAAALLLLAVACPRRTAASPASASAAAAGTGFAAAAHGISTGGRLTLTGLQLEGRKTAAALDLERVEVWSRDAQIVIHGPGGSKRVQVRAAARSRCSHRPAAAAAPQHPLPRGSLPPHEHPPTARHQLPVPLAHPTLRRCVAGDPHSHALLAVGKDGNTRGMALIGAQAHSLGKPRGGGALRSRRVTRAEGAAAAAAARARHPLAGGDLGGRPLPAGHEPAANVSAPGRRLQQVRVGALVGVQLAGCPWHSSHGSHSGTCSVTVVRMPPGIPDPGQ